MRFGPLRVSRTRDESSDALTRGEMHPDTDAPLLEAASDRTMRGSFFVRSMLNERERDREEGADGDFETYRAIRLQWVKKDAACSSGMHQMHTLLLACLRLCTTPKAGTSHRAKVICMQGHVHGGSEGGKILSRPWSSCNGPLKKKKKRKTGGGGGRRNPRRETILCGLRDSSHKVDRVTHENVRAIDAHHENLRTTSAFTSINTISSK